MRIGPLYHNRSSSIGTRLLLVFLGLFVVLTTLVIIGMLVWYTHSNVLEVKRDLVELKPYFTGLRLLLLALLIGLWDRFIPWVCALFDATPEQTRRVTAQRWRMAIWLIITEVALVQGVVGTFLRNIFQGS